MREFASDLEKWAWIESRPAEDVRDPELQAIARALRFAALDRPRVYAALAMALARDGIRFERDIERVGHEDLGDPITALKRGVDDCDAKARLFVALCLSVGIRARIVPWWRGQELAHVNAAVELDGKWRPVELTLARARVGDAPNAVPSEKDTGQWLM